MSKRKKKRINKTKIKKALGKQLEPKCRNCQLFDKKSGFCKVVILYHGQKFNLPVDPNDDCFFEGKFEAVKQEVKDNEIVETKETFVPADEIKQARFWVEDPKTGKPTDKDGIVKIEYDEGFFGEKSIDVDD